MKKIFILLVMLLFFSSGIHAQTSNDIEQLNGVKWQYKTNGPIFSSAVVYKDIVLIGSSDSVFYLLNKYTGKEISRYKTNGQIRSTPAIKDDVAYFYSGDGILYSMDLRSFEVKTLYKARHESKADFWDYYDCSPVVEDETVFFGSGDKNMYAINIKSGKKLWNFKTDGIIHATPCIAQDKVLFGSYDGYFYALDAKSGKLKWKFKTVGDRYFPEGAIQKGASVYSDGVYFGSRDYNVYALDIEKGRGLWNMKEVGSWVVATPIIKDDIVYFGTSDTHAFYALDAVNGDIKWKLKLDLNVFGNVALGNSFGYFGTMDGKLYAVDLLSGTVVWHFQTESSKTNRHLVFGEDGNVKQDLFEKGYEVGYNIIHSLGSIMSTPVVNEGCIYFGSTDGHIYAIY